jgi:hypothetical protein
VSHDLTVERLPDATPEVAFDAFVDTDAEHELYADAPDWIVESEMRPARGRPVDDHLRRPRQRAPS